CSRASRRVRARKTQAGRCRSSPLSPGDDPAAKAETPRPDLLDARVDPKLELALLGPVIVEVADARPKEASDLRPPGRDQPSGRRQADPDVELPERTPRRPRQA